MIYDIVIIGCGPAGMMAAIYALRANKKVLVIEKETIGGKISSSPLVENFPGFIKTSGMDLANNLYEQMMNLGGDVEFDEILSIEKGPIKKIIGENQSYEAKSVIIATGTKHKKLGLPNEEELIGNGISFCTVCDGAFYKNEIVAVVGGGNTAVTDCLDLASICQKVYLIVRKDHLKAEASLQKTLKQVKNVEILFETTVEKLEGETELEAIIIKKKDQEQTLKIKGLFLAIGQMPENNCVKNIAKTNDQNFIITEKECVIEEGIYAVGDCREKEVYQLTTAVSDGTIAAIKAIKYLDELERCEVTC